MNPTYALLGLLFTSSAFAQENWRPNDTIPRALSLQVTKRGFDSIEGVVVDILPGLLAEQDLLQLDDIEAGSGSFGIQLRNIQPTIDIRGLDILPVVPSSAGVGAEIQLRVNATLALNSQAEPYYLGVSALFDLCDGNGWMAPTAVTIAIPLQITVVTKPDNTKGFDVNLTIPSNSVAVGSLQLRGECDGLLNTIGNALTDVIVDAVLIPQLRPTLEDLEPTIEEALAAAVIDQEVDALGKTLFVELTPLQIKTNTDGLEFIYNSRFSAAQDACVREYDPLASLKTDTPIPALSSNPPSTQIAAYVSDDMMNQALYAAFSGGILCVNVDEELLGDSLPIALDSSLVGLLGGPGYDPILPVEPAPLIIQTRPRKVPQISWSGDKPITLGLDEFGLDFYTEIEGRQARVIGLDLQTDVGLDVDLDGATGSLAVLLDLDPAKFNFSMNGDVFVPGTEQDLIDAVGGLMETILPLALGGLTDSLSFTLPSFSGLGLTDITLGPGGTQSDWLRAEVAVGPVTYGEAGCDSSGGGCGGCEGSSDCGGGCSSAGLNLGTGFGLLLPIWALRRRRRG